MDRPTITKLPALILAGGLGTRLRPVLPLIPKVLAPLNGRPFLEFIIKDLRDQGINKIIISAGYLRGQIKSYFKKAGGAVSIVEELKPLGTGGAVKQCLGKIPGGAFMVLNGDSFCEIDFKKMFSWHLKKKSLMTMALTSKVRPDGGKVSLGKAGRILKFLEKNQEAKLPLMNAGIYIFNKKITKFFPRQKHFSLEFDLFPRLIKSAPCFGYVVNTEVIDIGTPKRYAEASRKLKYHAIGKNHK